jgi:hypothetical protein
MLLFPDNGEAHRGKGPEDPSFGSVDGELGHGA